MRITSDPADLAAAPAGKVYRHAITQLDISASRIRALIAAGRSPRYLLPDAVLDHIKKHRLYQ
jgi:nicotinate-nucleotide adenylyltransferase